MSVFIWGLTCKWYCEAILSQIMIAESQGIYRIGVFDKSSVGVNSKSCTIQEALNLVIDIRDTLNE